MNAPSLEPRGESGPGAKRARLAALLRRKSAQAEGGPLSFTQEQMWFLSRLEGASPVYNIPLALRLEGELEPDGLRQALTAVVARHASLRTAFVQEGDRPVRQVVTPSPVPLETVDLATLPEPERPAAAQRVLADAARRPFDLTRHLMLRVLLVRLGLREHWLLLVVHHIAADAWSLAILSEELSVAYEAARAGRPVAWPAPAATYDDYVHQQRRQWSNGEMAPELAYWQQALAGPPSAWELPTDAPASPTRTGAGAWCARRLDPQLAEDLRAWSRKEGVTLFMTLLASFQVLLRRYTGQEQGLIGTPVAGRTRAEWEGVIGPFINTLVLRADLGGNPSFRALLGRVRETVLGALAHQDLPFEKLVEALQPERRPGHNPLVQVLFVLQNTPLPTWRLGPLAAHPLDVDTGTAKFDLTLSLQEQGGALACYLEYRTDLFAAAAMERLLGHYQQLLQAALAQPDTGIEQLPLLTPPEYDQIVVAWNQTRRDYPREGCVHQLWAQQVQRSPAAVALQFAEHQLSYRELDRRANALAHRLRALGVGPESLVGVCAQRSLELVVGLLAILKAGGAYVPLDPDSPKERLQFMLQEAGVKVLLAQTAALATVEDLIAAAPTSADAAALARNVVVVRLEPNPPPVSPECDSAPPDSASPDDLAYVSFTSGSTGQLKAVAVPHRGVVRLVKNTDYLQFTPDQVFLQLAPVAFDASTLELWGPLLNGGRLVMFPPHVPSLTELGAFIQRHKITTLWLTAGLFHAMVEEQIEALKGVRELLAGGDVLSVAHVRKVLEQVPSCRLVNGYGPTENTTFTCCHTLTRLAPEDRSVPIGRPIANTRVYVLDDHQQPVPVGIPGELYAGGDGLARGYLNRPDLTAERFLPDPFSPDRAARLYRTGDQVRWRADGVLEFLGRLDAQVKISGFRVELGEIEARLAEHPEVRACVVVAHTVASGDKRLAAYIVPAEGKAPPAAALQAFLRPTLPPHLVPASFTTLAALPLTPNGKVDRRALPPPDLSRAPTPEPFVGPRDPLEARLAAIWEKVLGVRPIGVHDRFFDLGGYSMLAVRLAAQVEKVFDQRLAVNAIFQFPTIAQLARLLGPESEPATPSALVALQPEGTQPPLVFVHGAGGGMFWGYHNLARYLGGDQPVYGLRSRGAEGGEEFAAIPEMATQYVRDLRAFQPHGPYYLGGYCFGGTVAYEMARQLVAQGDRVALLALINCSPPNSSYSRFPWTPRGVVRFLGNLLYSASYMFRLKPDDRRNLIRWRARVLKKRLGRLLRLRPRGGQGWEIDEVVDLSFQPAEGRQVWETHVQALIKYQPGPYPGRVTLFRTRGHPAVCSFDEAYGWGELAAGGVTVKVVPGAHESILDEPHVRVVARELAQCLTRLRNDQTP